MPPVSLIDLITTSYHKCFMKKIKCNCVCVCVCTHKYRKRERESKFSKKNKWGNLGEGYSGNLYTYNFCTEAFSAFEIVSEYKVLKCQD